MIRLGNGTHCAFGAKEIGAPRRWASRAYRRDVTTIAACAAVLLLLAACGGASGAGSNNGALAGASGVPVSGQTTVAYGQYVGNAGTSLTISFTASPSGIEGLTGEALLECTQTTGNSVQYGVNSTIPLSGDGSFSSDTTITLSGGGTAELKVSGALDRSGHANGTLSYNIANACDTGATPEHWSASVGGSTTPTAAANSATCAPQPCSTSGGLTVSVTKLTDVYPAEADHPNIIEVEFTVTNNDVAEHNLSGALDYYGVQPGNEATIPDDDVDPPNPPDGTSCRADDADLQPGAHSPVLHTCVNLTDSQMADPLKFIWSIDNSRGVIDLTNMTIAR